MTTQTGFVPFKEENAAGRWQAAHRAGPGYAAHAINQRPFVRESTHITDLCHKLRACNLSDALHAHYQFIFGQH